jgi:hypothetical protein
MARTIHELFLECMKCGHTGSVSGQVLENKLGDTPTFDNITEIITNFVCAKCRSKQVRVFEADDRILFDPSDLRRCEACNNIILAPRIRTFPTTSLCHLCAQEKEKPYKDPGYPMPPPSLAKCPRCHRPSIVRQGSTNDEFFIGCTGFPSCRWTSALPEKRK